MSRDSSESGFCLVECGMAHTMRRECAANPCLAIGDLCRTHLRNSTVAAGTPCSSWCCPTDTAKVAGAAIGFLLMVACLCSICLLCFRRRRQLAMEHSRREQRRHAAQQQRLYFSHQLRVVPGDPLPPPPGAPPPLLDERYAAHDAAGPPRSPATPKPPGPGPVADVYGANACVYGVDSAEDKKALGDADERR